MGRLIRIIFILAIGTIAGWPAAPQIIGPANEIPSAAIEDHGHLRILRLRGTPYEMGYQHGQAERKAIRQWINELVYDRTILALGHSHAILLAYTRQIENRFPADIRRELRGIADGAGAAYEEILLLNLVLNRPLPISPLVANAPPPPALALQALTFAASPPATQQNEKATSALLGYLLDAPGQATRLRRHLLVIIYQPAGGQSYATLTWSGQVGAWCGLNKASLAICATPVQHSHANQELAPAILVRQLLAQAQNSEQALRQAIQNDYLAAFQLLIADGQSQLITVIDFGEHKYEIIPANESNQGLLTLGPRAAELEGLLSQSIGKFNQFNRDKALATLNTRANNSEKETAICSESTLLNALFVPGQNEIWIGLDLWPASCRRYLRFNPLD